MTQVSPTIELEEKDFGDFNERVVALLLKSVEDFFRSQGVESTKKVVVVRHAKGPRCCATSDENVHRILLITQGDKWCQWVFQFAHEYCHHLIDGGLLEGTKGLRWLEESLCHVASYVCLDNFERICAKDQSLSMNVPCIIKYIRTLLTENGNPLYNDFLPEDTNPLRREPIPQDNIKLLQPFVESRMEVLSKTYSTDDYETIARALFPHFYNNEKLWRILPHLGDTMEKDSLQGMFELLLEKADNEYRESLLGLMRCLV